MIDQSMRIKLCIVLFCLVCLCGVVYDAVSRRQTETEVIDSYYADRFSRHDAGNGVEVIEDFQRGEEWILIDGEPVWRNKLID